MTSSILFLAFLSAIVASDTAATDSIADDDGAALRTADECPALFGDALMQTRVAERRAFTVESVNQTRHLTTVFHSVGKWQKPTITRLAGVQLVDVIRADDEIVVDVREDSGLGCPSGRYRVPGSVAFGRDDHVVALLESAILVERRQRLVMILKDGGATPNLDLIWRSPYAVVKDSSATMGATTTKSSDAKVRSAMPASPESLRTSKPARERAVKKSKKK